MDAAVIARYGALTRPLAAALVTDARAELAELLAYRQRLSGAIAARQQQLGHL